MNVIAFSSIKGGVGKSSCAILTASCLAAAQARVLIIDTDLNNSTTFFFSTEGLAAEAQAKNIAAALSRPDNNLNDFICKTANPNIDIIPSSVYLIDLRGISERRLAQLLPASVSAIGQGQPQGNRYLKISSAPGQRTDRRRHNPSLENT